MTTGGLRERKKQATRAALAAAALRLAAERGVDAVTVEDIATAADVSPRTFFNHFATKEEAFVADDLERARGLIARFQDQPADEPVWATLTRLLGEHLEAAAAVDRTEALRQHAVRTHPDVLVQQFRQYADLEGQLVAEVARRTGTRPTDLQPRLLAASVVAAMRAAVETWLEGDHGATPRPLFDRAVAQLAPAFPQT
jgi:AcrR family transcriptional regulator